MRRTKLPKEDLDRLERACIQAGYSPKNARRQAARLLRRPRVQAEIERQLKEMHNSPENIRLRAERVVLLSIGLIIDQVTVALWILAVAASVTAIQRLALVWLRIGRSGDQGR